MQKSVRKIRSLNPNNFPRPNFCRFTSHIRHLLMYYSLKGPIIMTEKLTSLQEIKDAIINFDKEFEYIGSQNNDQEYCFMVFDSDHNPIQSWSISKSLLINESSTSIYNFMVDIIANVLGKQAKESISLFGVSSL